MSNLPLSFVTLVAFLVVAGGIVRRRSCCGCEHPVLTLSVVDCLVPFLCLSLFFLPGGNVVFSISFFVFLMHTHTQWEGHFYVRSNCTGRPLVPHATQQCQTVPIFTVIIFWIT